MYIHLTFPSEFSGFFIFPNQGHKFHRGDLVRLWFSPHYNSAINKIRHRVLFFPPQQLLCSYKIQKTVGSSHGGSLGLWRALSKVFKTLSYCFLSLHISVQSERASLPHNYYIYILIIKFCWRNHTAYQNFGLMGISFQVPQVIISVTDFFFFSLEAKNCQCSITH